jgi:hypothetical protein
MEQRLEELRPLGEPRFGTIGAHTGEFFELTARHQSAASNLGPITLTAPIAGMVHFIQRQPGEHVLEGNLVTISRRARIALWVTCANRIRARHGLECGRR